MTCNLPVKLSEMIVDQVVKWSHCMITEKRRMVLSAWD